MQKKWIKKKQKAERDAQAKAKAGRLAKLRDPKVRRGFRKLVVAIDKVFLWRAHGSFVEIRTPRDEKLTVSVWELQGYEDEAEWHKEHEECYGDDYCDAYMVTPKLVRDYVVKISY